MKKAILVYANDNYKDQLRVMKTSCEQYGKEFDLIVEYNRPMLEMTTLRYQKILRLFADGYNQVVFSGADQVFFSPFKFPFSPSCILFPHCTEPLPSDGKKTDVHDLLRCGTFNADLQVWNSTLESIEYLRWISSELQRECVADFNRGLFYDQTYLNFAPVFLKHCYIDRTNQHNIAFYNLHHNVIQQVNGGWFVNDSPLGSFHFTGFVRTNPARISKHQDRLTATGDLLKLMEEYAGALK